VPLPCPAIGLHAISGESASQGNHLPRLAPKLRSHLRLSVLLI
jgi:hypothetical protein